LGAGREKRRPACLERRYSLASTSLNST
jgi:hypothetical protein